MCMNSRSIFLSTTTAEDAFLIKPCKLHDKAHFPPKAVFEIPGWTFSRLWVFWGKKRFKLIHESYEHQCK